jgi:hypothetical protein
MSEYFRLRVAPSVPVVYGLGWPTASVVTCCRDVASPSRPLVKHVSAAAGGVSQ